MNPETMFMCFVALGYYMKSTASFSRVVSYDADDASMKKTISHDSRAIPLLDFLSIYINNLVLP